MSRIWGGLIMNLKIPSPATGQGERGAMNRSPQLTPSFGGSGLR